jgi:hypothetical protein
LPVFILNEDIQSHRELKLSSICRKKRVQAQKSRGGQSGL